MGVRFRDSKGNVIADFDHEPSEEELASVFAPPQQPEAPETPEAAWKRIRATSGLPEEPWNQGEAPAPPAPAPEPEGGLQMSNLPNVLRAGRDAIGFAGKSMIEATGIPQQAISSALKMEEVGSTAFPRKKEWDKPAPDVLRPRDTMESLPFTPQAAARTTKDVAGLVRKGTQALHELSPEASEWVSALFRSPTELAVAVATDPRSLGALAAIPSRIVGKLLAAGFTADMLVEGREGTRQAIELMKKEGVTPDVLDTFMRGITSLAMGASLAKSGAVQGAREQAKAGKPFIDPETGNTWAPRGGPREGTVVPEEPGRQIGPGGRPAEPVGEVVDAEVLARDGVREPGRQLERGPLTTPRGGPETSSMSEGNYPPGPASGVQVPFTDAEMTAPPAALTSPVVDAGVAKQPSPGLQMALERFAKNPKGFGTWLNKLEKAAKTTQNPEALALVQEARRYQAEQLVSESLGQEVVPPVAPDLFAPGAPPPPAPAPTPPPPGDELTLTPPPGARPTQLSLGIPPTGGVAGPTGFAGEGQGPVFRGLEEDTLAEGEPTGPVDMGVMPWDEPTVPARREPPANYGPTSRKASTNPDINTMEKKDYVASTSALMRQMLDSRLALLEENGQLHTPREVAKGVKAGTMYADEFPSILDVDLSRDDLTGEYTYNKAEVARWLKKVREDAAAEWDAAHDESLRAFEDNVKNSLEDIRAAEAERERQREEEDRLTRESNERIAAGMREEPAPGEMTPPPGETPVETPVEPGKVRDANGDLLIPGFAEAVASTPLKTEGRLEGGLFEPPVSTPKETQLEMVPPPGEPVSPPQAEAPAPAPPPQTEAQKKLAQWKAEDLALQAERDALAKTDAPRKEKEVLRLKQVALRQKIKRAEDTMSAPPAEVSYDPLSPDALEHLPNPDPAFLRSQAKWIAENEVALPSTRPDGWTPENERALELLHTAHAARAAHGKGGKPDQQERKIVVQATEADALGEMDPEVVETSRDFLNNVLKVQHLGDLLVPGAQVPGRHLRLGVQGPRVTVVQVLPSGMDFVVKGAAGELQTVNIGELSGKNYNPYHEMSAEAVLDVATKLMEKDVQGTRKGELGAVRPGALFSLLGAAVGTAALGPMALAHPGETIALGLISALGVAAYKGRVGQSMVAATALARASAAGRLAVAAVNALSAGVRMGTGAIAEGAAIVGSLLLPNTSQYRADATARLGATFREMNIPKGAEEVLVGVIAGAMRDPAVQTKLATMNPVLAAKSQAYLDAHMKDDRAWHSIMELAGVPAQDVERFAHFTQGTLDPSAIERLGKLPAALVNSMLIFNAAIDRVTRNAYVQIAMAPMLKKYGVSSLQGLLDSVWQVNPITGERELAIPLDEYKDVEYAIDTAITGAMNYSGGLTAEKVHFWRFADKAVQAISQLPLPLAMLMNPNAALFANYVLVNVPEVLLQHSPFFFAAPRFKASMEARGIQDKAYVALANQKAFEDELTTAKEFLALERKRLAPLMRKDPVAYQAGLKAAKDWVADARQERDDFEASGAMDDVREWRKRRRSRYYNKQQLGVAFGGTAVFLATLAMAYRFMRDEDGTAATEIKIGETKEKDGSTSSKVMDLKRVLGPLGFSWWMGDMIARRVMHDKDPKKFANVSNWLKGIDAAKAVSEALGNRYSPLESAMQDADLTTLEGVDQMIRTLATQVGGLYSSFGGWMGDIYQGGVRLAGGNPETFKDPTVSQTTMPPITEEQGWGAAAPVLGERAAGALERTFVPNWFASLQEKAGVPEADRVHIADAWDKLSMQRRPLQNSPLSWFFTLREQSSLTRFLNNVEGDSLKDILPGKTGVEWYDTIVNQKIADLAKKDHLFQFLDDEKLPPEVRYQGLKDRMQAYRLQAHTDAKRYGDKNDLLLPNAAAIAEAARAEKLRRKDRGQLGLQVKRKGMPWLYNQTAIERQLQGREQRQLMDELEMNLPPIDLDGPPIQ